MVLAVHLNMPRDTAIATVNTLSDVEALLLSKGGAAAATAAASASNPAETMAALDDAVKVRVERKLGARACVL